MVKKRLFITLKDKKHAIRKKILEERMENALREANKPIDISEEDEKKVKKEENLTYEEKLRKRRELQKMYRSRRKNGQPNLNDRMKVYLHKIEKRNQK